MSLRKVTSSLHARAHKLHDVLLPAHPADRLGSKEGALNAMVSVFEGVITDVIETLDDTDLAVYRVKRALDNDEEPEADDIAALLEAYEVAEGEIDTLEAQVTTLEEKLDGVELEATAPKVAAVLSKMERDCELLRKLEAHLVEDGTASAHLALTRLAEWRDGQEAPEEPEDL